MRKQLLKVMVRPLVVLSMGLCAVLTSCQDVEEAKVSTLVDQAADINGTVIPGKYIVVLNDQKINFRRKGGYEDMQASLRKEVSSMLADFRVAPENVERVFSAALEGFAVDLTDQQFKLLSRDSRVKFIEPDRVIALAPPPGKGPGNGGGGEEPSGEMVPYGISRVGGPVDYTGDNVAFVIDTGIDLDHPDLNVDASKGFNAFNTGKDSKSLDDGNGHGSHVAGTIAAINNNIGVIGVAAGATVVPVKVLDSRGSGSYSGVIAGVDFVKANGKNGDVANMSLGGPVSNALDQAVKDAADSGIKFSLAAGNDDEDANGHSPARANGPNIYTVSAMDKNDNFAYFSNFSNPPVDYCAPGVSIESTWKNGGYNTISGTSMAAPHVAGILLLGNIQSSGTVNGDPDDDPDPIASH
ncbi:S8 family peptidase [Echinicola shivajiensis]|uniref:S8 family peptidase n=1 Tax=Echinicola shivajiensis TaxID=1035916 RepID=UPI001FE34FFA|nr:S8 family peptidase [Echinicola shivajiensis]